MAGIFVTWHSRLKPIQFIGRQSTITLSVQDVKIIQSDYITKNGGKQTFEFKNLCNSFDFFSVVNIVLLCGHYHVIFQYEGNAVT
jgi:hypothetical protein